ncbi:MAG TPA: CidA/LrgA family protein [Bacilli bacterium]|nr:CidA/LrgA family protein [Bacilli bacterium]HQA19503.1 CidA/LrgA family protein [Bacilli bacterium]HQD92078.1 CidA/LrgA family protein [Bacilli bacterium]
MKIIKQIFIILLFYVIGEVLSFLLSNIFTKIYFPGTILGLIIFLLFLLNKKIKIVKLEDVDEVGSFLTNNMAFFFIPAAVSVVEYFDVLQANFIKIVVIIIISLLISFIAITYTIKLTIYIQQKFLKQGESK